MPRKRRPELIPGPLPESTTIGAYSPKGLKDTVADNWPEDGSEPPEDTHPFWKSMRLVDCLIKQRILELREIEIREAERAKEASRQATIEREKHRRFTRPRKPKGKQ